MFDLGTSKLWATACACTWTLTCPECGSEFIVKRPQDEDRPLEEDEDELVDDDGPE